MNLEARPCAARSGFLVVQWPVTSDRLAPVSERFDNPEASNPAPGAWASRMRYAVRDEPCMTRLATMAVIPASTALAAGDPSMSVIGFDPCACC